MTEAEPTPPEPFRARHTVAQRMVLFLNCIIVLLCFAGAVGLIIGKSAGEKVRKVAINTGGTKRPSLGNGVTPTAAPGDTLPPDVGPDDTFPEADPEAVNFLVTGADNSNDKNCAQLQDKGARSGERSDTIMVVRLDPATKQSAVLSFPRDLYVKIPGNGTSRINSAYRRDDPQLLIDTIQGEFGVPIDHFIQVDFCAFQKVVSAVGGVGVPLPYPVRDTATGLNVDAAGCYNFDGVQALEYVRSRHLEYLGDDGKWHKDPSADLGRIARQQDFLRRTLSAALKGNLFRPRIIKGLYESYRDDIVVDTGMTIDKMIEFAGVIRDVEPSLIRTYQVEATGKTVSGNAVLIWHKNSENMQAILDIFRGLAPLANAPEQQFETTTAANTTTTAAKPATGATSPVPAAVTSVAPSTNPSVDTTPVDSAPESNAPKTAIVPDPTEQC
ncbi:MAG TPA: LCP family protein, partial [Ilumatobacteraceae bacterium]|nr:LCP family protein [Ilumatobacteraceae bacterium]